VVMSAEFAAHYNGELKPLGPRASRRRA